MAFKPGDDVAAVFARAERGEPLRYVAIGGSITQAEEAMREFNGAAD